MPSLSVDKPRGAPSKYHFDTVEVGGRPLEFVALRADEATRVMNALKQYNWRNGTALRAYPEFTGAGLTLRIRRFQ